MQFRVEDLRWARYHAPVRCAIERMILIEAALSHYKKGCGYLFAKDLADACGVRAGTIRNAIHRLEVAGLLYNLHDEGVGRDEIYFYVPKFDDGLAARAAAPDPQLVLLNGGKARA